MLPKVSGCREKFVVLPHCPAGRTRGELKPRTDFTFPPRVTLLPMPIPVRHPVKVSSSTPDSMNQSQVSSGCFLRSTSPGTGTNTGLTISTRRMMSTKPPVSPHWCTWPPSSGNPGEAHEMNIIGRSHYSGATGELYSDLETMTTALHIADKTVVKVVQ